MTKAKPGKTGNTSSRGRTSAARARPSGGARTVGVDAGDTRRALMELLKRAGEADVASLAAHLGISPVAVRQHLSAMQRDGQVTHRSVRRPVGRPARLFRLTETGDRAFPQTSDQVALDLLARLEEQAGPETVTRLLESRARDLEKHYRARLKGARSWRQRLAILAEIRDDEGCLCELEPAPPSEVKGGMRLVHHHCPISDLARQHPEVCRYELELFRRVLGEPRLRRVGHIRCGGQACVYEAPAKRT